MRRHGALLLLIIAVVPARVFGLSEESQAAYQHAQDQRAKAEALLQADPTAHAQAEAVLLDALAVVRSREVRLLYAENPYLEARQWDLLRDAAVIAARAGDPDRAVGYLSEIQRGGKGLGWVAEQLSSTLGSDDRFQAMVRADAAWQRVFRRESVSPEPAANLSDADKLFGLSRFWSEAKFAFPYFDQVPELDWDATYHGLIPKVLATEDREAYYREMMRFAAMLSDGHTNVYPPPDLQDRFYSRPPVQTELIEGRVIVTDVFSPAIDAEGLVIGDEILRIDGREVHAYAEQEVRPFASASTEHDRDLRTYSYGLLNGDPANPVTLTVVGVDGNERVMALARSGHDDVSYPPGDEFRWLDGEVAYVSLGSFGSNASYDHFAAQLDEIMSARGLIIDVRRNGGGSSYQGWRVLAHLTEQPIPGSSARVRSYNPAGRAWGWSGEWETLPATPPTIDVERRFDGPVAVLIGTRTFSAAEDFALSFDLLDRGLLVGSATAGSTGQPLSFDLPGGGTARICTKRDTWPDGSDWVGVGILPDIEARKSIHDVRIGRDAVLAAALEHLTRS